MILGDTVVAIDIDEAKQQELGGFVVNLDEIIGIKASWFSPKEDPTIEQSTTSIGGGSCRFVCSQSDCNRH